MKLFWSWQVLGRGGNSVIKKGGREVGKRSGPKEGTEIVTEER